MVASTNLQRRINKRAGLSAMRVCMGLIFVGQRFFSDGQEWRVLFIGAYTLQCVMLGTSVFREFTMADLPNCTEIKDSTHQESRERRAP